MPEPTSRRVDGPTPVGGAYAVCYYSYDGRPVSARFANQMTIVEYDESGGVLQTTFGTTSPAESLPTQPPFPEFDEAVPELEGAAAAAAGLGENLQTWRLTPRRRPVDEAGPFATQAVCLARARVAGILGESDLSTAMLAGMAVLENRPLDGRWLRIEVEGRHHYLQVNADGSARHAGAIPDGADDDHVIDFDVSAHLAHDEQRLREVVERLEASSDEPDREAALVLARRSLHAGELAQALWDDLRRAAHAFVAHVDTHGPASIPVTMAREALDDLADSSERARQSLGLDALVTGSAVLVARLGAEMAAVDEAHLRWYYHRYTRLLDTVPEPRTPNLHRVAMMLARVVTDEGLRPSVERVAAEALAHGDATIAQALAAEDIDDFYWLIYRAVVPLQVAEIAHRALAGAATPVPGSDRMVNLIEEKRVRATASLRGEAEQAYAPLLADSYRTVQEAVADAGDAGARRAVFELAGHSLSMSTAAAETLRTPGLDADAVWADAVAARAPLRAAFAPRTTSGGNGHG